MDIMPQFRSDLCRKIRDGRHVAQLIEYVSYTLGERFTRILMGILQQLRITPGYEQRNQRISCFFVVWNNHKDDAGLIRVDRLFKVHIVSAGHPGNVGAIEYFKVADKRQKDRGRRFAVPDLLEGKPCQIGFWNSRTDLHTQPPAPI